MNAAPAILRRIHTVEFHRTKYGRELLIDVIRAARIPAFDLGGKPHALAFYEVFLITRGRGSLTLDGRDYAIAPGSLFFTSPGQPRQWRARNLDGLCLFFTADFLEEFFKDPLFLFTLPYFHRDGGDLLVTLGRRDAGVLAMRLESMQREIGRLRVDSSHALRAALYGTLIQLARVFEERMGESARDNPTALRLRLLIEKHFRDDHRPVEYAQRLRITVGHLNHLSRRHLGRAAGAVIRGRLALEAKRQLQHTDATAAEVGYALGFKDPAYFARFFRRETSVSPSVYRSRVAQAARRVSSTT